MHISISIGLSSYAYGSGNVNPSSLMAAMRSTPYDAWSDAMLQEAYKIGNNLEDITWWVCSIRIYFCLSGPGTQAS